LENDNWYCGFHAPSQLKRKEEKAEKRLVNKRMF
jgi:hypothetical protein